MHIWRRAGIHHYIHCCSQGNAFLTQAVQCLNDSCLSARLIPTQVLCQQRFGSLRAAAHASFQFLTGIEPYLFIASAQSHIFWGAGQAGLVTSHTHTSHRINLCVCVRVPEPRRVCCMLISLGRLTLPVTLTDHSAFRAF